MSGSADPAWTITTIAGDNNPSGPFSGGNPWFDDFSIG